MREISHPPRIMEMSQFPVATSSSSNENLGIHFKKWLSNTLSEIANIVRGKIIQLNILLYTAQLLYHLTFLLQKIFNINNLVGVAD